MQRSRSPLGLAVLAGGSYVTGRRAARRPAAGPRPSVADLGRQREAARLARIRGESDPGSGDGRHVPGGRADTPGQIPAQGWKQVFGRAWKEQKEDNVGLMAAGVAYYAFTALFPLLIAAVTLYGLVADPAQVADQLKDLTKQLPPDAASLITGQLTSVAGNSSGALGVGLAVSLFAALFSASGGVGNLIKTINIAYDEEETRGFLRLRALALALTLGAVLFVVVAVGLIAVLPAVLSSVGLGSFASIIAFVLRWVGLVVFMMLALAVLYRYAPDRDAPKFRWVGLGALVATALWIVASAGFSVYVNNFGSYGKTYGALAGVIVLLLWFYITAFIVLLGAEINAESEQQTEKDSTVGPERPQGQRAALKADTGAGGRT